VVTPLKSYVAKRARKKRRAPRETRGTPSVMALRQGQPTRARDIYQLYVALQTSHAQWVVPYDGDTRTRTCFQKLAAWCDALEAQGMVVDIPLYLRVHKDAYGPALRPFHLIGPHSLGMYTNALEAQQAVPITPNAEELHAYDTSILAELATLHEESPEIIAALLQRCGLL
jgi:hypothetical protein